MDVPVARTSNPAATRGNPRGPRASVSHAGSLGTRLRPVRLLSSDRQLVAHQPEPGHGASLRAFVVQRAEFSNRFREGQRIIVSPGAPRLIGRLVVVRLGRAFSVHRVISGSHGEVATVPDEPAMLPLPELVEKGEICGVVLEEPNAHRTESCELQLPWPNSTENATESAYVLRGSHPGELSEHAAGSAHQLALRRHLQTLQACTALAKSVALRRAFGRQIWLVQRALRAADGGRPCPAVTQSDLARTNAHS
jgi:hypothetical protein